MGSAPFIQEDSFTPALIITLKFLNKNTNSILFHKVHFKSVQYGIEDINVLLHIQQRSTSTVCYDNAFWVLEIRNAFIRFTQWSSMRRRSRERFLWGYLCRRWAGSLHLQNISRLQLESLHNKDERDGLLLSWLYRRPDLQPPVHIAFRSWPSYSGCGHGTYCWIIDRNYFFNSFTFDNTSFDIIFVHIWFWNVVYSPTDFLRSLIEVVLSEVDWVARDIRLMNAQWRKMSFSASLIVILNCWKTTRVLKVRCELLNI